VSVGTLPRDARGAPTRAGLPRGQSLLRDRTIQALAALTLLAALLRFYRIGHQGFWFDEANASADMHYSLGKMLGLLPQNQTTPPLYYLVGWVWARAVGFSEVPLRSLSALAGVASVPVIYVAGAKLISRRVGLIAAALTACNPFLVWYSQEARPYELVVLLSAASLVAFGFARERPSARTLSIWGAIGALGLMTHYYALLVVVPEAIWLLALHRRRRCVQVAVAVVAVVGVGLLPLAIAQNHTGNASWIAPIPLLPRLGAIVPQFLIGFQAPAYELLLRLAELIAILALAGLALRADPDERRAALMMGALVVGGLVLNLILIAAGIDDLITRNIIALWPPAALLVAGGLGARRAGVAGIAGTVALCAIGIVAVAGVAFNRNFQRPDWRGVARVLGMGPAPGVGARAILIQHYHYLLPLSLYVAHLEAWPRRGRTPYGGLAVRELDIVAVRSPSVALCWWGAACNLTGSRLQRAYRVPGFHELWVRKVYQFTIMRLVSPVSVVLTPAIVSRALTVTTLPHDELLRQR
jgi:4-amino-4-deoxy-L-arabinose transferase-like glycosyltransferase